MGIKHDSSLGGQPVPALVEVVASWGAHLVHQFFVTRVMVILIKTQFNQ